ncbi:unnamed protein product [Polarella glacialis]|uniref:Uncharacterized protein n=1 Tax=Polarella glacialis TaxID=89957 RepID=A0A813HVN9_POLGL|nr:unnamed protein product [Polarella glacialis]
MPPPTKSRGATLGKGALREALAKAATSGQWTEASELYVLFTAQPGCKDLGFWDFLRQFRSQEAELQRLRDEAQATQGENTLGYVPQEIDCPGRHWATPFITWDDGFDCSLCKQPIAADTTCLACRICDHDVCPPCQTVGRSKSTPKQK